MESISDKLTVWDYFIVVGYLAMLLFLGFRANFGRQQATDTSMFLAGKSLGWPSIGFNMCISLV